VGTSAIIFLCLIVELTSGGEQPCVRGKQVSPLSHGFCTGIGKAVCFTKYGGVFHFRGYMQLNYPYLNKMSVKMRCLHFRGSESFLIYINIFKRLSLIYDLLLCVVNRGYWLFPYHFSACSQGLYKAGLGNTQCQSCPANSTVVGAVTCNCTRGHYRMHGEGAADPCTSKLVGVLF